MAVPFEEVRRAVLDVLQAGVEEQTLTPNSGLLGEIPEFDSMAVVSLVTELEERFGIEVDDEEVSAENFATFGAVHELVAGKIATE
jgi:acyl carrier protein